MDSAKAKLREFIDFIDVYKKLWKTRSRGRTMPQRQALFWLHMHNKRCLQAETAEVMISRFTRGKQLNAEYLDMKKSICLPRSQSSFKTREELDEDRMKAAELWNEAQQEMTKLAVQVCITNQITTQKMTDFSVIFAATPEGGLGFQGRLPWRIPRDMDFFKKMTMRGSLTNIVIMGRKTWLSIPQKFRPLPGRINIVVSTTLEGNDGCLVALNFLDALKISSHLVQSGAVGSVFVCGGASIYKEALQSPYCKEIIQTAVVKTKPADGMAMEADVFMDKIDTSKWEVVYASEKHEKEKNPDGKSEYTIQFFRWTPINKDKDTHEEKEETGKRRKID
jgi:dihydrofolate reductase